MKNLISLLSIIILSANLIFAQIINIPADYPTIQEGIDAAVDGDTVLVAPGTYYENIKISKKEISLASWYLFGGDTSYISQTIIDGNQSNSVVRIIKTHNYENVFCGFTITNGYAYNGGGIYMYNADIKLNNLIVSNNIAVERGGGIACFDASPILNDVIISNNITETGDGGGMFCTFMPFRISTFTFAPSNSRSYLYINKVKFLNNTAGGSGGGYCNNSWASSVFEDCVFENNIAGRDGGGVLFVWEGDFILKNVKITNNTAGNNGGGIWTHFSFLIFENVEVGFNSAEIGGGMYISNPLIQYPFKNILVHNNTAQDTAGGLYLYFVNQKIMNLTVVDNDASVARGIFCKRAFLHLENSIVFGDNLPQRIVFDEFGGSSSITISHSLIQGGEYFINTNDNGTVNWLEGNINQNPVFVNSGDYPYQINDNSPCVDAGSTDTTGITEFDLAGEPRFFNGRIDMGAYEWNTFVGLEEPILSSSNWDINIFPNPFTTTTTFEYTLPQTSSVQITIFNHLSEEVEIIRQKQSEGKQQIVWNAEGLLPGVYFYRIRTAKEFASGKMLLLK